MRLRCGGKMIQKQLEITLAERGAAWFIMRRFAHVAELADALL